MPDFPWQLRGLGLIILIIDGLYYFMQGPHNSVAVVVMIIVAITGIILLVPEILQQLD